MRLNLTRLLLAGVLGLASTAWATTWYVNGVTGNDSNNCTSAITCRSSRLVASAVR
jgi:hypothetical protein